MFEKYFNWEMTIIRANNSIEQKFAVLSKYAEDRLFLGARVS